MEAEQVGGRNVFVQVDESFLDGSTSIKYDEESSESARSTRNYNQETFTLPVSDQEMGTTPFDLGRIWGDRS